jgi:hypothetical protein
MTKMMYYNISKKSTMLFFVILSITILFVPNHFLKSASADYTVPRYYGEIIFPSPNNTVVNTNQTAFIIPPQNATHVNTNQTIHITPPQNIAYVNTNRTVSIVLPQNTTTFGKTNPGDGFSNIVCKSGYQYVQMTGQYTAGNISYKVIFLRMALLDSNGSVIAKGFGFVEDVDAYKTKTFNAITRYPSTFSSCTIQIDNAIPK